MLDSKFLATIGIIIAAHRDLDRSELITLDQYCPSRMDCTMNLLHISVQYFYTNWHHIPQLRSNHKLYEKEADRLFMESPWPEFV